jgi:hypothetical protein
LWMSCRRRRPDWWRQVAYSGTKLLYQPEPKPVVYIIPVKNILGRLALVPYGAHGTIPYDWHPLQRSHSSYHGLGVCDSDAQGRPGSGSRLFYINSWAMIWLYCIIGHTSWDCTNKLQPKVHNILNQISKIMLKCTNIQFLTSFKNLNHLSARHSFWMLFTFP